MNDIVVAVCGADCGVTPPMPYVGEKFDGRVFTAEARHFTEAALLRCGFDVIDVSAPTAEPQDSVMAANHGGADCAVVLSYASFGSGRSFNDVKGPRVCYAQGRTGKPSRILAEDICSRHGLKCAAIPAHPGWSVSLRPTVIVDGGYLTNFDDAKLICDPDYAARIGEAIAMGLCENYAVPYIPRLDAHAYPVAVGTGKRGKPIKLLQALLCARGYVLTVDGVYGRNTDLALKRFAIDNEIEGHGVEEIISRLILSEPSDIRIGSASVEARYIQSKLRSKLYVCPQSGVLCEKTVSALNAYLSDIGFDVKADESTGVTAEMIKALSPVGGGKPRLF